MLHKFSELQLHRDSQDEKLLNRFHCGSIDAETDDEFQAIELKEKHESQSELT